MSERNLILEQMPKVMKAIGAITKDRQTNFGERYKYRGIDDALLALQPALIANGITLKSTVTSLDRDSYTTTKGSAMQRATVCVEYEFIATDGSSVCTTFVGEGSDVADKAILKAMSAAMKTCVFQTFVAPVEDVSVDNEETQHDHQAAEKPATQVKRQEAAPAGPALLDSDDWNEIQAGAFEHLTSLKIESTKGNARQVVSWALEQVKVSAKSATKGHLTAILDAVKRWPPESLKGAA